MEETNIPWGEDLVDRTEQTDTSLGLESFSGDMNQAGPVMIPNPAPWFKPVNIIAEQGLYYASIYLCDAYDGTPASQQVMMWLASLKETDYVHLTLGSLLIDVPLPNLLGIMGALASTKATIDMHLDTIVVDSLSYFYLLADTITKGSEGAMFIPSYVDNRAADTSGSQKALHDFFKWVVEMAVTKDLLTAEEADKLNRGSHVVIPDNRF